MTRPAAPTIGGEPVSRDTPARRAPPATGRAPCGPRQGPGSANRPCKCRSGNVLQDRKSTRLNSSHGYISYAVFCLKKKKKPNDKPSRQLGNNAQQQRTTY